MKIKFTLTQQQIPEKIYDVVIVGGGPAGLSAALYATRFKLSVVVVTEEFGGQLSKAALIENYLGFISVKGPELANIFYNHVQSLGVPIIMGTVIDVRKREDEIFEVLLSDNTKILTKTVIIAVGVKKRKLGVVGEDEFIGRGVSYCAICDAPLYKDKVVAIVGGGNSALQSALLLSEYASKVYLIHRREEFRADPIYVDKVRQNSKIELLLNYVVKELRGDKKLRSVIIQNVKSGEVKELQVDGIFVEIGFEPPKQFFEKIGLEVDELGYVKVDNLMRTNIPGIFAAGDCTNFTPPDFKQVCLAVAQGALAAYSAYRYLIEKFGKRS